MDEVLYSRLRLAIVVHLLQSEWMSFTELVTSTGATRGNLSAHLEKLRSSGIVEERKSIRDRRSLSRYRITSRGREAFVRHMQEVKGLFEAAQSEYGALAPQPETTLQKKVVHR